MIVATLPDRAWKEIGAWVNSGKLAVHRIIQEKPLAHCKNCQDEGYVYVSYLGSGPSMQPVTTAVPCTWVDKSEMNGAGWYVIENTIAYECPRCHDLRIHPEHVSKPRPEVLRQLQKAAKEKRFPAPLQDGYL
jgi:hypothetical protein